MKQTKMSSKQIIINTTYAILLPMVSALMVPPTNGILSKVKPSSGTSLDFHNPNMDHLDSQGHYKARDSSISLGNRFRTVPKPYYESAFQHQPASPMRTSAAARSSSSEYSDYGTQDVYWSDVNGFPQDVVDPAATPSMDDVRNGMGMDGGRMNADDHVYSPDKYYPHQDHATPGSSSSKFEDIPFQSNENYSRKFQRHHAQGEGFDNMNIGGGNMHAGMNGEFGQRPMDRPYSPDMMGQGGGYGGGPGGPGGGMGRAYGSNNNGMQGDFPSLMNEIMPPPGGMGMMGDPYSPYGQQQGYGGGYGGHPYGMMEQPGMMMGVGMDMHHHGDFGFQGGMGGMGPGGCEEFGGPHGPGGGFGQQQPWGMEPMQGHPFGGQPFPGGGGPGGPGGFW